MHLGCGADYLATTLHQGNIYIHNLVLPDQHADEEVEHGQRGNNGLDNTVHQPNQHDDGVVGHLHHIRHYITGNASVPEKLKMHHETDMNQDCLEKFIYKIYRWLTQLKWM